MILPRYEEACRLYLQHYRDQAEIQPQEIAAYTAFLAEDRLNQGFSPEVERETARIHQRAKVTHEKLINDLNALSAVVKDSLTPEQQRIAENYKPDREAVFARFASAQERHDSASRTDRRKRGEPAPADPEDARLADARKELEAINEATRPHPDALAKHLLTPAAAKSLYELAGMRVPEVVREAVQCRDSGTREYPRIRCAQDQKTLQDLRAEINHWNLANGMHFDRGQIEQLVRLSDEAEKLRTRQQEAKPKDKVAPAALNAELVRLETAAEAALRPGQQEVLKTYKPCLIPPKNLKDPVRVGQASDNSRMGEWLTRARGRPPRQLERMIDRLIEEENGHLGSLDEAALEQRRSLLAEIVRQVTEMSDVEFALKKDELADAIRREDRKDELIADIEALRRERHQPGRTAQFLLNREFAEVLKVRYEQLAGEHPRGGG
jgi:hypothetical protein